MRYKHVENADYNSGVWERTGENTIMYAAIARAMNPLHPLFHHCVTMGWWKYFQSSELKLLHCPAIDKSCNCKKAVTALFIDYIVKICIASIKPLIFTDNYVLRNPRNRLSNSQYLQNPVPVQPKNAVSTQILLC